MVHRPSLRHVLAITAGALGLAVATLAPLATADASARMCAYDHSVYKIMGGGSIVWIGTNRWSAWTQGKCTITRTYTKTAGTSSSHGESDSVSGGVNWGVVSADYNHEWNRSTSSSTSWSNSWSSGRAIPGRCDRPGAAVPEGMVVPGAENRPLHGRPVVRQRGVQLPRARPDRPQEQRVYCYVRDSSPAPR